MRFLSQVVLLGFPTLIVAQQLHGWGESIFAFSDNLVDGDVNTSWNTSVFPSRVYLLTNSPVQYSGLYIQSSDAGLLTDYYVEAYLPTQSFYGTVGSVANATSNFTLVTFKGPDGRDVISTDQLYLYVTGARNGTNQTTAIIEEIYPIFPLDEIYYPPGSPSPTTTRNWATSTVTWSSWGGTSSCSAVSSLTDTVPYPFPSSTTQVTLAEGSTSPGTPTSGTVSIVYTFKTATTSTVTYTTVTNTVTSYTPSVSIVNKGDIETATTTECDRTYPTLATEYTGTFTPATSAVSRLLPVYDDCTFFSQQTTMVFVEIYTSTVTYTFDTSTVYYTPTVNFTTTLPDSTIPVATTTISKDTTTTVTITPKYGECYTPTATTTITAACNPTNIMNDLQMAYQTGAPGPYATSTSNSATWAVQCCEACINNPDCAAMSFHRNNPGYPTIDYGSCILYISNTTDETDGTCGYAFDVTQNPETINGYLGVTLGCGKLWDAGAGAPLS